MSATSRIVSRSGKSDNDTLVALLFTIDMECIICSRYIKIKRSNNLFDN